MKQTWTAAVTFFYHHGDGGISEAWLHAVSTQVPELDDYAIDHESGEITLRLYDGTTRSGDPDFRTLAASYAWIESLIGKLIDADLNAVALTGPRDGHLGGVVSYQVARQVAWERHHDEVPQLVV